MEREKFELLYSNIFNMQNITKRKLKELKPDNNNIGFIHCNTESSFKELTWIITSLEVKFNRIYLYIDELDSKQFGIFETISQLFSDIIVPVKYETDNDIYAKIYEHVADNIYILSKNVKYTTLKTPDYHSITCLCYNDTIIKREYCNSCISIRPTNVQMKLGFREVMNPIVESLYIRPYALHDIPEKLPEYMSLIGFLTVYSVSNKLGIDYIKENQLTTNYDQDIFNSEINKYLSENELALKSWHEVFPQYVVETKYKESMLVVPEVAFISLTTHQCIIETINTMGKFFYNCQNRVKIFDNIDNYKFPENTMYNNRKMLTNKDEVDIIYNNLSQEFEPAPFITPNRKYGKARYEQIVKYLIDDAKADLLYVIGDKIILTKNIYPNESAVWTGSLTDNEPDGYVEIFNIKLMKQYGIKFKTYKQFFADLTANNLLYETRDMSEYGMTLPKDFEKYNSRLFRVASTKERIIFNYMADNYNYYFATYENNDRYNQL